MNSAKNTSPIFSIVSFMLVLVASFVVTPAQSTSKEQKPEIIGPANPVQTQQPANTQPQTTINEGSAEQQPIYGLQGVLIETLDGRVVASQSPDQALNPASAVKLATALVALRTFGPVYRFTTGIWTNGFVDKPSGTLLGDLYVSGRDPSFHDEHAIMIAKELNALGIRIVKGNLIVAPGFTMNFNWSARRSGERLYDTLDSTLRPAEATSSWIYSRSILHDQASLATTPSVTVMGEVLVKPVPPAERLLMSHQSSKLTDILKILLCYSNNFMAERLGDSIGGVDAVERNIITSLQLQPGQFRLSSLSGLRVNRVTPTAMMKIYRALRDELRKNNLSTTDIMPVAGIDPGTLRDRFADYATRGSVVAKTGTLIRTDGGASALVGQMKTMSGETLLFVILNQRGSVSRFRDNQDFLVKQVQNSRGGPRAFDYTPLALPMRLADTTSTVGNEYEPTMTHASSP